MNEQSTISSLKGIGEKTEKLFQKLNIFTIGELLRHFPRGYEVYEEATPIAEIDEGRTVTVTGAIYGKVQVAGRTSMRYNHLCEGCHRNFACCLVPNAFFAKYVSKRGRGHTPWKSRTAERNTSYGAAGNFLSKRVI